MHSIKFELNGEARKKTVSLDLENNVYHQVKNVVTELYSLKDIGSLKWIDDDGDLITASSDAEMKEAIQEMTKRTIKPILRFTVEKIKKVDYGSYAEEYAMSVKRLILEGCMPELTFLSFTKTEAESNHEPVSTVKGTFNLCVLPDIQPKVSALIAAGLDGNREIFLDGHNKASIDHYVMSLVSDILKGLNILDTYTVQPQVVLDFDKRGDIFVLTVFGAVVLTLQDKRPRKFPKYDDSKHLCSLGQAYDYLATTRMVLSVGYSFAVWCTYSEMQIIWPNDQLHHALAAAVSVPTNGALFPQPLDYDWKSRVVAVSQIYRRADNIPMVLACLIYKLHHSFRMRLTPLTRHVKSSTNAPKMRAVHAEGYCFSTNKLIVVTFRSPAVNSKVFYLLQQKVGRDGRAWTALSTSGKFCVVKFRHSKKVEGNEKWTYSLEVNDNIAAKVEDAEGNESARAPAATMDPVLDITQQLESVSIDTREEMANWKLAYSQLNVRPFQAILACRPALVLPFAFCYRADGTFSAQLSSHLPCDEDFAVKHWTEWWSGLRPRLVQFERAVGEQRRVMVLFRALKWVASRGIYHDDIKWDHIALLPIFEGEQVTDLVPIVIDLSSVAINSDNPLQRMYEEVVETEMLNEDERKEFLALMHDSQYLNS